MHFLTVEKKRFRADPEGLRTSPGAGDVRIGLASRQLRR